MCVGTNIAQLMSCIFGSRQDFEVVDQRCALDFDLAGKLVWGDVRIVVLPRGDHHSQQEPGETLQTRKKPKTTPCYSHLYLNCSPQLSIQHISVNGHSTLFQLRTPFHSLHPLDRWEESDHDHRMDLVDEGELQITIPSSVQVPVLLDSTLFQPIFVAISYTIANPRAGLVFLHCETVQSERSAQLFLGSQEATASCWMPCRDSHWERFTFQLVLTLPAHLQATASGTLESTEFTDATKTVKRMLFAVKEPTLAMELGFCLGDFGRVQDPLRESIHYLFPLPHSSDTVLHSTVRIPDMLRVYESYLQMPFPTRSLTVVFVDAPLPPNEYLCFETLILLPSSLLHSDKLIDQTWITSSTMARAIAHLWVAALLRARAICDQWVLHGLVGFLQHLYLKKAFGRNEAQHRLLTLVERVVYLSRRAGALPLHTERFRSPWQLLTGCELVRDKSTAVMLMLEGTVGEDAFLGTIRHVFTECKSRPLSSRRFFKFVKHRSALVLEEFRDRWILGTTCPSFSLRASFNRKKNWCEMRLTQNKTTKALGMVTVHIFETDRQTYLHRKRIEGVSASLDAKCHSKVRKNRKRVIAGGVVEDEDEYEGRKGILPNGEEYDKSFILKNDTPVRWVVFDPKGEWLCRSRLQQMLLWNVQAVTESNVFRSQLAGVRGIGELIHRKDVEGWVNLSASDPLASFIGDLDTKETGISKVMAGIETLQDCMEDSQYFHVIRTAAVQALANCSSSIPSSVTTKDMTEYTLPLVLEYYRKHYYDRGVLQPNDFSDFSEYLVQRSIPVALSHMTTASFFTPTEVTALLLDILRSNDNSQNYYSDCFFLADILKCLAHVRPSTLQERRDLWTQIMRYLNYDKLLASHDHCILKAALTAASGLMKDFGQEDTMNRDSFKSFLSTEYSYGVRLHAFGCMAEHALEDTRRLSELVELLERQEEWTLGIRSALAQVLAEAFLDSASAQTRYREAEDEACRMQLLGAVYSEVASVDTAFRNQLIRLYTCIWPAEREPEERESSANYRRRAKARAIARAHKPYRPPKEAEEEEDE